MELSLSMYSYVRNRATTYVDATGLAQDKPQIFNNVDPALADQISAGFAEALNRIKGNPTCADFFGCERDAEETLKDMLWGTYTDKSRPRAAARTNETGNVVLFNTAGNFFGGDGYWIGPGPERKPPVYFFGNQATVQAFLMLHELAHHFPGQTHFAPDGPKVPDADVVNESNSLMLINACFRDARKMPR